MAIGIEFAVLASVTGVVGHLGLEAWSVRLVGRVSCPVNTRIFFAQESVG